MIQNNVFIKMFAEITKGARFKRNLAFATFPVLGPFRNYSILTLLILASILCLPARPPLKVTFFDFFYRLSDIDKLSQAPAAAGLGWL